MVTYAQVQASNETIASQLTGPLVAVFIGATSGIGEHSVKRFAKRTKNAKIYLLGRSQAAADRIKGEIDAFGTGTQLEFLPADLSLIRNVDKICAEIQAKEKAINVLFMSQGNANFRTKTEEGLNSLWAVGFFGRLRFIHNLVPQLSAASGLRRVVSVLAGTKEGPVYPEDLQGSKVSLVQTRGHLVSAFTLSLEQIAAKNPTISFVHDYPGFVRGSLLRDYPLVQAFLPVAWTFTRLTGLGGYVEETESGERHVFLATSVRYPPASPGESSAQGVPLLDGLAVSVGTDGKPGSGVYVADEACEAGNAKVVAVLEGHRQKGYGPKIFATVQQEWARITSA
ncbi:hypothetical protein OC845_004541 [Tilletia horrida]|nr:hypothetical protein OC845_004541 [Tilletia horrida]